MKRPVAWLMSLEFTRPAPSLAESLPMELQPIPRDPTLCGLAVIGLTSRAISVLPNCALVGRATVETAEWWVG